MSDLEKRMTELERSFNQLLFFVTNILEDQEKPQTARAVYELAITDGE